jgi:hypothetical protein
MVLEELNGKIRHLVEAGDQGRVSAQGAQVAAVHGVQRSLFLEQLKRNFFEVAVVNLEEQRLKTFTCIQLFAYFETVKNTE